MALALPDGVDLVLGGTTSDSAGDGLDGRRVLVLGTLAELDHWLAARRTK